MKQTSLHDRHLSHNAKMAPFAGFDMPIQYSGIVDEHMAVRKKAGVFDVSHMGNLFLSGKGAKAFLQKILTGNLDKYGPGMSFYSLMCTPNGGAVDDLFVYQLDDDRYMIIVNASNVEKDLDWLRAHAQDDVKVENLSDQYAILAVQGPAAAKILDDILEEKVSGMPPYTIASNSHGNVSFYISRTGYTGEDGFEISVKNEGAGPLWDALLAGGIKPCGLGARDTLRLEMGYTLYGHEISQDTNVIEAGLGWLVDLDNKGDFIGKAALVESKKKGLTRKLAGLICESRGIPRAGCKVFKGDREIGAVTSGGHSPVLNCGIALAFVGREAVKLNDTVEIEVRGRRIQARVTKRKFLNK
jgi:aminomethyltransferase